MSSEAWVCINASMHADLRQVLGLLAALLLHRCDLLGVSHFCRVMRVDESVEEKRAIRVAVRIWIEKDPAWALAWAMNGEEPAAGLARSWRRAGCSAQPAPRPAANQSSYIALNSTV